METVCRSYNPTGEELVQAIQAIREEENGPLQADHVYARLLEYHPDWNVLERRVTKFLKRAASGGGGNPNALPNYETSLAPHLAGTKRKRECPENTSVKSRSSLRSTIGNSISNLWRRKKRQVEPEEPVDTQVPTSANTTWLRSSLQKKLSFVKRTKSRRGNNCNQQQQDSPEVQDPDQVPPHEQDAIQAAIAQILQKEEARQRSMDMTAATEPDHDDFQYIFEHSSAAAIYQDDNDGRPEAGCNAWLTALWNKISHPDGQPEDVHANQAIY